jgi:tetratricopeptide (TPR) repeat protein
MSSTNRLLSDLQDLNENVKVYGLKDYKSLGLMENYMDMLRRFGDYTRAETQLEQILELRRAVQKEGATIGLEDDYAQFSSENDETIQEQRNLKLITKLADIRLARGEYTKAEKLQQLVLQQSIEKFGVAEPFTLKAMEGFGSTLFSRGELAAAEKLYKQVVPAKMIFEPGEWSTVMAIKTLCNILHAQGKTDEAEQRLLEALDFVDYTKGRYDRLTLMLDEDLLRVKRSRKDLVPPKLQEILPDASGALATIVERLQDPAASWNVRMANS